MENCIFCRITRGEIKSDIVYSDKSIIGFKDINPQAPVHLLFIPKEHIERLENLKDPKLLGELFAAINKIIMSKEYIFLHENGFRLVINSGVYAGQTVDHLHVHILGGREFSWPPG